MKVFLSTMKLGYQLGYQTILLSLGILLSVVSNVSVASEANAAQLNQLKQQVIEAETAFAKSMAQRDHASFVSFLAEDAIFFSGSKVLRGKQEVADAWHRFYIAEQAPFSWEVGEVEVLESGNLAISVGPVRDLNGKLIANFSSIWRLEPSGVWRIVFDRGTDVCHCKKE
ncbi:YybH family protein [Undibacterium sp. Ji22W]|uniref:YybH family protein n=1 Tax=Undibacterium sp. Ji22W TaxID=3413038 RepID=UPI003BF13E5D